MQSEQSTEESTFRAEVRAFIESELPQDLRHISDTFERSHRAPMQAWQAILDKHGWGAPSWPAEYGGCGWTPMQELIFEQEQRLAGAPLKSPFGLVMVGPVIYTFGNAAQKEKYLPSIRNGSVQWCQGYSEPGSGSDLASLKTSAVRDGDDYVVNGQKIWTTGAHNADWMFCLVRTSTEGKPQAGISFLLIDMQTPGIEVRAINTIDGLHHLNEVYFTDVRVPAENLVGEENKGWTYAKFLLTNERASIAGTGEIRAALDRLDQIRVDLVRQCGDSFDNSTTARHLADLRIRLEALETTERRALTATGAEAAMIGMPLKLLGSDLKQDVAELGVAMMATGALPVAGNEPSDHRLSNTSDVYANGPNLVQGYMIGRAWTILGGTSEVQRNIMAAMVLGLH